MTQKAIRISVGARTLLAWFVLGLLLVALSSGWDLREETRRRAQQQGQELEAIPLLYTGPLLHSQGQPPEAIRALLQHIVRQHGLRSVALTTQAGEEIRAQADEDAEPGPSMDFALGSAGALRVQAQAVSIMQTLRHDALLRGVVMHLLAVVLLGLVAAVALDRWLLRQLRRLTEEVHRFEATMPPQSLSWLEPDDHDGPHEVLQLERAFAHVHTTLGGELQREQSRGRQLSDEIARQHQRLEQVERSLEAKRRELAALERHDPLTGAANRREFELSLRREFKRVQRDQGRLALAVIDVDDLKPYNERHGRDSGDDLLKRLVHLLAEQFQRDTDIVARLGGEEFVVLMPGLDIKAAQDRMESVRDMLRAAAWPHGALPASRGRGGHDDVVSVSIGLAAYQPGRPYLSAQALMQAADEALYLAKHTGRDRICLAS